MSITASEIRALSEEDFDKLLAEGIEEERARGSANLARVDRTRWCECSASGDPPFEETAYYHDLATGRHGWFHDPATGGCGGVTQTG